MKKLIFFAFILLPVLLSGQVLKGTGISYFDSIPNVAPAIPKGTELAFGIKTKKLYRWDRTCSCWIEIETSTDSLARTVAASGLFNQYAIPFGGSSGKLDQDVNAFKLVAGQLQVNSMATLGSAGAGYLALGAQSAAPATPVSGIRVYADGSGRFGWIGTNGFTRVFDASGITANRNFKLQNKSYTLADSADVAALSTSLPGSYFPLVGGTLTGTGGSGFVGFPSQAVAPGTPASGLNVYAQGSSFNFKGTDGHERQFASTLTGGRTYTLPDATGTFALLERSQTFTGANTFSISGASGSGFTISGTTQFAIIAPKMTDAQISALTGNVAGGWVFSNTQNRPYVYGASAYLGVMLGPQAGITAGQLAYGGSGGNLTSSTAITTNGTTSLNVGTPGNGNQGTISFPNSISGFSRYINAPLSSNEFEIVLAGSQKINLNQNSISITTAQSGTFLQVVNGGHYGDFMKFRSYSNNGYGGGFTGLGTTSPASFLHIAPVYNYTGDISGTGYFFRVGATTVTNNTTANGGTVSSASLSSFDGGAIASVSTGVVYTNAATLRIGSAPTAGTNSTLSNTWALWVASGNSFFNGNVTGAQVRANSGFYSGLFVGEGVSNADFRPMLFKPSSEDKIALFIKAAGSFSRGSFFFALNDQTNSSVVSISDTKVSFWNTGQVGIGTGTTVPNAAAIFQISSTTQGWLGTVATTAQINSIPSPPLNLRSFSTTNERQKIKRSDGWYDEAFLQDVKRDTTYRVVDGNLNLSALTAFWKANYKRIVIETVVTSAAPGDNTITLPVPSADLFGIKFEVVVEDTSGDSDISQLIFGTDFSGDGYSYNGDGTFISSFNLYGGIGVYLSVAKCEAKGGAYRWVLQ